MNTKDNTGRKEYIDIARGIAMICIVLGHLGNASINRLVFTFHVPIFYLVTGYFTDQRITVREYISKRFRTLVVPYLVTCLLIVAIALALNQLFKGGVGNKAVLSRWVLASLYGAGDSYQEPFVIYQIGAIWYLLASFWGSCMLRILLETQPWKRLIAVGVIFALSCWTKDALFWFPLSIQAGGCALLFMYIGYISKIIIPFLESLDLEVKAALICMAGWLWGEFVVGFQSFWLVHCDYGRGVIDIIGSLCACICLLLITRLIEQYGKLLSDGLAYLGRYSLFMLCMHIIELDLFPWQRCGTMLFGEMSEVGYLWFLIVGKFLWIIPTTILLAKWNVTRRIFGYK